jgi:hypothetical protein
VNFLLNTMEVIPQAQVLESLRLFAREVMPALKKNSQTSSDRGAA